MFHNITSILHVQVSIVFHLGKGHSLFSELLFKLHLTCILFLMYIFLKLLWLLMMVYVINGLFLFCFRYNNLSSIPKSLANCVLMDEFNLEGNKISQLPVSIFPQFFVISLIGCTIYLDTKFKRIYSVGIDITYSWSCYLSFRHTSFIIQTHPYQYIKNTTQAWVCRLFFFWAAAVIQHLDIYISVGNVFFSYLVILASCFKIVLAKLELHLPSLASG